ncbi:MAG: tRNA (adenosine(37)-N6)-threonylcarbamoyltransferase complex transferase subunit TsaD [Dehalococcoidia bacterium]|nr:tRNA (adenosine(37)-N6)-threonylcarbamoyltransferase complex transferase subunit TsaD [Dehalococcoidia bacterium]MQG00557.1 tRNA (adenosine(37)-N6)-threonylcarbamoyltransferase complex transferase subunit TsaD [SAR202 cluster bacterium]|tara:strand:- start:11544 stop:12578 length:1035 start_codon:yes stop_codon:yes gene_type:complete
MKILGIETSCDETAISLVEDGRSIMSNVIASQVEIHARYGGIVPEVASRQHMLEIVPTLRSSLDQADTDVSALDAIAVTNGPGLAGALLVGVNFAKAISFGRDLQLIGVNHLEGHIYANWLEGRNPETEAGFPLICLIASGGHTDLVLMSGHGSYRLLGRTRDDAAGEAFDKAARVLGLGFPGGPAIQKIAEAAKGTEILPRAWLRGTYDFSFSGIKTALLNKAKETGIYPPSDKREYDKEFVVEIAAAFQLSLAEVMVAKTIDAAREYNCKGILLGGGVAANSVLRQMFKDKAELHLFIPSPRLCTDNGAMIASCAYFMSEGGRGHIDTVDMDVNPSLKLGID